MVDAGIDQREPNSLPAYVCGDAHDMYDTFTLVARHFAIVA